ncbi:Epoxyqueuosine reductase [hydrothermal vent metagenome]|uniref:Epoxyqueuosine reductase n=1 Tax=hydrothermal vent metagenome TaxID=652676 RepID=A0A3B0VCR8_9ZZZZ
MPLHSLQKKQLSNRIKAEARKLGFFACGISRAEALPGDAARVEKWLEKGMQGEMQYLERNREKRYDATRLVDNARSVISVLFNYFPAEELPEKGYYKIAKYAYGKDYHYILKQKLALLLEKIENLTGKREARIFTDSAPVLDRAAARRAGLGFTGKNTLLINRQGGSFFFIGHIILDLDLTADREAVENYCGSCTKCIDACPTAALSAFELDARKCISYLTIEYRGEKIPDKFQGKWKQWIFGCDICQDVCPWNRKAKSTPELAFQPSGLLLNMQKADWDSLDKPAFKQLFKGSAVERTGFKGFRRNIGFLSSEE